MVFERDSDKQAIIAIVGPTATGKTAVAMHVAKAINGEIISADSQAVYRGMDIGTAKPTVEERETVPFHLVDVAEPDEAFNVSLFKNLAVVALDAICSNGHKPILAGGTGLYVRALLEDYGLTETPSDSTIRDRLNAEAEALGVQALHGRLASVDLISSQRIHPNDRIRIVRALEVFERTGTPISVQQARDAETRHPRPSRKFGLTASRDTLDQRIDERVDKMIAQGFVDEVKALLDRRYTPTPAALMSLGYKEITGYLLDKCDLDAAIYAMKQNTRRFAKRQLTWFRADPNITWIEIDNMTIDEVSARVLDEIHA